MRRDIFLASDASANAFRQAASDLLRNASTAALSVMLFSKRSFLAAIDMKEP